MGFLLLAPVEYDVAISMAVAGTRCPWVGANQWQVPAGSPQTCTKRSGVRGGGPHNQPSGAVAAGPGGGIGVQCERSGSGLLVWRWVWEGGLRRLQYTNASNPREYGEPTSGLPLSLVTADLVCTVWMK